MNQEMTHQQTHQTLKKKGNGGSVGHSLDEIHFLDPLTFILYLHFSFNWQHQILFLYNMLSIVKRKWRRMKGTQSKVSWFHFFFLFGSVDWPEGPKQEEKERIQGPIVFSFPFTRAYSWESEWPLGPIFDWFALSLGIALLSERKRPGL